LYRSLGIFSGSTITEQSFSHLFPAKSSEHRGISPVFPGQLQSDDFKSDESRKLYKQLVEIKQIIIEEEHQLQKQRIQYESDSSMREKLYPIIIKEEQLIQKQKLEQIAIEKRIRNIENEYK